MKKCLFIICMFLAMQAMAKDYYVTTANEVHQLNNTLQAGDVVIWKNGNYTNQKIIFEPINAGSKNEPIILKAEQAGKVVYSGSSNIIIRGKYIQVEGFWWNNNCLLENGEDVILIDEKNKQGITTEYCTVKNCAVTNYTPTDESINSNDVAILGKYNTLEYCSFWGKKHQGPNVVVRYKTGNGYKEGSDMAPSTYHHIHHNFFGYRTMPEGNGGEVIRVGDSKTSFTKGFNIIEYNYFTNEVKEPEVISNKSCYNTYRFNSFVNNEGAMVLRHGNNCLVYGNYFNGSKTAKSGGIRIINPQQTVFNNYINNIQASADKMKAAIVVMSGLEGSPLNGYYAADSAIVAYNIINDCNSPAIKLNVGNTSKGLPLVLPNHVLLSNNIVTNINGSDNGLLQINHPTVNAVISNNFYYNAVANTNGFKLLTKKQAASPFSIFSEAVLNNTISLIQHRANQLHIVLSPVDIIFFNTKNMVTPKNTGTNFLDYSNDNK
jgi:poly(beta-D-mannuronate) lyase